jgi:hypothetical protein
MKKPNTLHYFLLLFFLFGCADDPGPDYPPLKKEQLVGCWAQVVPEVWLSCREQCFSNDGKYYDLAINLPDDQGVKNFSERSGTYRIIGVNGIDFSYLVSDNVHHGIDSSSTSYKYTIISDTLNYITDGHPLEPWTRSDSLKNCGSHWRLFPKPADWELP